MGQLGRRLRGKLGRAVRAALRLNRNRHCTRRTILCHRLSVLRLLQPIYRADQQKNRAGNNQKVDKQRNEIAVVPRYRAGLGRVSRCMEIDASVFRRPQDHKLVRKIESTA